MSSRSLTIRLPLDLYLSLADAALAHDSTLNRKIVDVLRLGLGKHVNLDDAVRQLLVRFTVSREPA